MTQPTSTSVQPRRWLQFNLRMLLGLMTIACAIVAFRQAYIVPFAKQRAAADKLKELGGAVETRLGRPAWLRHILGDDNFQDVVMIHLERRQLKDDDLACLIDLPKLERLYLAGTAVSDKGLTHLSSLKNLRRLSLWRTKITNDGLFALAPLESLQALDIHNTSVTDPGLAPLAQMPSLRWVKLSHTRVTAEGVRPLVKRSPSVLVVPPFPLPANPQEQQAWDTLRSAGGCAYPVAPNSPWARLHFSKWSRVKDSDLRHLQYLTTCHSLTILRSTITDAATWHIKQTRGLRHLDMRTTQLTDAGLWDLAEIKSLVYLNISHTLCTPAGVQKLRQALPHCNIHF